MTDVDVVWDAEGAIARIRLNRPAKLNALSHAMLEGLAAAVAEINSVSATRVVLITSTSERAFSVGADLHEWNDYDGLAAYRACLHGQAVFDDLARLDVPTIAVIDGLALGGGLELALACDLRIASDRAAFGLPEAKLAGGLGWGGLSRLVPLVGPARAKDLVFTGRTIDAAEALAIGLLTSVHASEKLPGAVTEVVRQISTNGPIPLRIGKQIIDALGRVPVPGLMEAISGAVFAETADAREGKAAFIERRQPTFRNS
ncbi:MAG: enoyl-CoA hydratase [Thermomicrobiales bacterium]|jgi:enoyl-CoA hydratase/carnithine racemase|nr:enoyl-CoA hydratase [Thermomicrobiales bacterium]